MSNICETLNCCAGRNKQYDHSPTSSNRSTTKEKKKKKRAAVTTHTQRILLLGTGESGKSTFLKQMRMIAGKAFTDEELVLFKDVIYENIYKGVLFLVQVSGLLKHSVD